MTRPLKARLEQEVDGARMKQEPSPPEPQRFDTCVLQNLDWVERWIESDGPIAWGDGAGADLRER